MKPITTHNEVMTMKDKIMPTFEESADFEPTVSVSKEPVDDVCPKCNNRWASHDFGVPEPNCPEKNQPVDECIDMNSSTEEESQKRVNEFYKDLADNFHTKIMKDKPSEPEEWEPDQKTIKLIANKLADVRSDLMGGYHDESEYEIFCHGMQTQVNVVAKMIIKSEADLLADEREVAIADAVYSLPKEEIASFEWNAHAERIIKHLHDSGRLTTPKN